MRSTIIAGFAAALALGGCGGEVPATDEGTDNEDPGTAQQALVAPDDVYVINISGSGSGCPPGSITYTLTPDRQTFIVFFSQMILTHPPGPLFQNINCPVAITLHVPNGWQFTVATINTRGFAHLPVGTYGEQRSNYFFAGFPLGGTFRSRLNGFFDGNYTFTDNVGFESVVWSPCGADAIFTINASLSLNTAGNRFDDAFIDTETIDGRFRKILYWQWRRC